MPGASAWVQVVMSYIPNGGWSQNVQLMRNSTTGKKKCFLEEIILFKGMMQLAYKFGKMA